MTRPGGVQRSPKGKIAARALVAGAFLLLTTAALRALWRFWTPMCNEACARSTVLAMYATMAAAVGVTLALVLPTALGRWKLSAALLAYAGSTMLLALWVLFLTRSVVST